MRSLLPIALALAALACGPKENGQAPAPLDLEALRAAPRGDAPWKRALDAAKAADRIGELGQAAQAAAAAHPDRWEPRWIAGECLLGREPNKQPIEVVRQAGVQFDAAFALATTADDAAGIAATANRQGYVAKRGSDPEGAEAAYRRALAAAQRAERADLVGIVQSNLAGLLAAAGRISEAFAAFESAIASFQAAGNTSFARATAQNRIVLLEALGSVSQMQEAIDAIYPQAVERHDPAEIARLCVLRGNAHLLLGELDEARTWFGRVPAEDALQSARAALGLGRTELAGGAWDDATRSLAAAAAARELSPNLSLLARTYLAEAERRAGRPEPARRALLELVEESTKAEAREITWMARGLVGKTLLDQGRPAEAVPHLAAAVEAIDAAGAGLAAGAEGLTFLRQRAEPFADLAAALVAAEQPEQAFSVVERAHARALRELLAGGATPGTASRRAIAAGLGADEALVDFLIGDDRGVVLVLRRSGLTAAALPGWSTLRPQLARYLAALRRPLVSAEARVDPLRDLARDLASGREVRRRLLGPVEAALAGAKRIHVVPDQDLALLPFAALPEDASAGDAAPRFLGGSRQFVVLPMAGTPPPWSTPRAPLLLAGDPLPDPAGEFGALPLAAEELRRVAEIWGESVVSVRAGERLTRQELEGAQLARFGTLHLATHAIASSRDPRRCAVLLSRGERLDYQTIHGLRLAPALVVLSACQTGAGEIVPGEGVVGLTWAFLRAGARGVVASLWSVEDESTTRLMVGFHEGLRDGRDPVAALSAAQRALAGERPHPVYWAGFVPIVAPGLSS